MKENFCVEWITVGNDTYVGKAARGSPTSVAVWQLFKVNDVSGTGRRKWADGTDKFDKIFDDYATYTY